MMTVQRGLEAGPGLIQRIRLLLRWVEVLSFCHPVSTSLVAFLLAPTDRHTLESTLRIIIQSPSPAVPCHHP